MLLEQLDEVTIKHCPDPNVKTRFPNFSLTLFLNDLFRFVLPVRLQLQNETQEIRVSWTLNMNTCSALWSMCQYYCSYQYVQCNARNHCCHYCTLYQPAGWAQQPLVSPAHSYFSVYLVRVPVTKVSIVLYQYFWMLFSKGVYGWLANLIKRKPWKADSQLLFLLPS